MPRVCVVVPCYNEANRLPREAFLSFLGAEPEFDFCFVDDGSADRTREVLAELGRGREDRVQVVRLEPNRGKAEAVRAGVGHALAWKPYEWVGYLDADLATPLSELPHLWSAARAAPGRTLILGSRVRRLGAEIERSALRHYMGRVFATAASIVLGLPVYDTQCGAKLVQADLARRAFDGPFLSRWLFDVELIARVVRLAGRERAKQQMLEVPLELWIGKADSRLKAGDLLRAPLELLRIHFRYRAR